MRASVTPKERGDRQLKREVADRKRVTVGLEEDAKTSEGESCGRGEEVGLECFGESCLASFHFVLIRRSFSGSLSCLEALVEFRIVWRMPTCSNRSNGFMDTAWSSFGQLRVCPCSLVLGFGFVSSGPGFAFFHNPQSGAPLPRSSQPFLCVLFSPLGNDASTGDGSVSVFLYSSFSVLTTVAGLMDCTCRILCFCKKSRYPSPIRLSVCVHLLYFPSLDRHMLNIDNV